MGSLGEDDLRRRMEYHVREILRLIGEDTDRPGIRETPRRFVDAILELTAGLRSKEPEIRFFPIEVGKYEGVVIVPNIRFNSLCEHHLLPIIGSVTVVYTPLDDEVPGLSKVARYVKWLGARLELQERFTAELANKLRERLRARYVYVKVCAIHLCTLVRGVKDEDMYMLTEAWSGDISEEEIAQARKVRCRLPLARP